MSGRKPEVGMTLGEYARAMAEEALSQAAANVANQKNNVSIQVASNSLKERAMEAAVVGFTNGEIEQIIRDAGGQVALKAYEANDGAGAGAGAAGGGGGAQGGGRRKTRTAKTRAAKTARKRSKNRKSATRKHKRRA